MMKLTHLLILGLALCLVLVDSKSVRQYTSVDSTDSPDSGSTDSYSEDSAGTDSTSTDGNSDSASAEDSSRQGAYSATRYAFGQPGLGQAYPGYPVAPRPAQVGNPFADPPGMGTPTNPEVFDKDAAGTAPLRRGVPMDRRGVPMDRRGVPMDSRGVPMDKDAVPPGFGKK